jgi:Fe-S cluster assembly ATPase SufC
VNIGARDIEGVDLTVRQGEVHVQWVLITCVNTGLSLMGHVQITLEIVEEKTIRTRGCERPIGLFLAFQYPYTLSICKILRAALDAAKGE